MKRRFLVVTAVLCLLLGGCSSWMDGEYVSVKPHTAPNAQLPHQAVSVSDYQQLRNVLEEMVEKNTESGVITIESMDKQQLDAHMQTAIRYVMQNNPIGAYAVKKITYDVGSFTGASAVSVNISYNYTRVELQQIRRADGVAEAKTAIATMLGQCEGGAVLLIKKYADTDFAQCVHDYAMENPAEVMEVPQVAVGVYPESGNDRVVSLQFVYQNSRETLRTMQSYVQRCSHRHRCMLLAKEMRD